jgi:3-oxoacyl-[acyl-carrier protein] reductase
VAATCGQLEEKVIIVTGSTKGFGEAMVKRFAAEGAAVVVTGRREPEGQKIAAEIQGSGGRALYLRSDVSDEASVRDLVAGTVEEFGRVDGLVNNAMAMDQISSFERPVAEMDSDAFDRILKVGLYGVFWASKYAIPEMVKVGGGSIVNISSVAAVAGVASIPAYSASKGAVGALTRQMATDYGRQGVRVNSMVCGIVLAEGLTSVIEAHPVAGPAMAAAQLTRWGTHDDITALATYLVSDAAGFVTGAEFRIDGGWTSAARVPNLVEVLTEHFASVGGA